MLKIRLQRVGRKNDPSFRVVLTDSKNSTKSGKFLEILGSYDPRRDNPEFKTDRVKHWISEGAQVSDTIHNLLVKGKIIEGKKINVLPKKSPIVKEKEEESTPTEAPAEEAAPAEEEKKEEPAKEETPEKE